MFRFRFTFKTSKGIRRYKVKKHALGAILIATGVLFLFAGPANVRVDSLKEYHQYLKNIQQVPLDPIQIDQSFTQQNTDDGQHPIRILIPSVSIDLAIQDAPIKSGKWEVFEDTAGFGLGSSLPSGVGNTVVFAHARKNLFIDLDKVSPGDEVIIFTKDNWYSYHVSEIKSVYPNDISVIKQSDESQLTLFTCTGYADTKRLIVSAKR